VEGDFSGAWIAWWFVLGAGAVSACHAGFVLASSAEFDQSSPVPAYQTWIAVAGVVAAIGFLALVHREQGLHRVTPWITIGVALIGVCCALPIWARHSTIDVTPAGFHRAAYAGIWNDLYVYNATDTPVVIHVSTGSRPDRTISRHRRVPLKVGTLEKKVTLSVAGSVAGQFAPGARLTASIRWKEPPRRPTV
jgi:hypothetical protein